MEISYNKLQQTTNSTKHTKHYQTKCKNRYKKYNELQNTQTVTKTTKNSMVKIGDVSFHENKNLREYYKAAQGLSNPRLVIFTETKTKTAGIVQSGTGLVKSQGSYFHRKILRE